MRRTLRSVRRPARAFRKTNLGVPRGGREGRARLQPGAERRGGGLAERARRAPSAPCRRCAPAARRGRRPRGAAPRARRRAGPSRRGARGARGRAPRARPRGPAPRRRRAASAHGERPGQRRFLARRRDRLRGVRVDAALALEEREERAERREVPPDRRLRESLRAQVREIRPHGEGVHVPAPRASRAAGSRRRADRNAEKRPRSAAVGGPRVRRDAALVREVAVERGDLDGEGGRATMASSPGSAPRRRAP